MHRITRISFIVFFCFLSPSLVIAQEKQVSIPAISLSVTEEDGQKVLIATLLSDGNPLKGVKVKFSVKRTFGLLLLGEDETLDDGTAATPFPINLPGDTSGKLQFVVEITSPPYTSLRKTVILDGGIPTVFQEQPFPRALWSPKTPLPLIRTIAVLLTIVWSTYAFVIIQLIKIQKEGKS